MVSKPLHEGQWLGCCYFLMFIECPRHVSPGREQGCTEWEGRGGGGKRSADKHMCAFQSSEGRYPSPLRERPCPHCHLQGRSRSFHSRAWRQEEPEPEDLLAASAVQPPAPACRHSPCLALLPGLSWLPSLRALNKRTAGGRGRPSVVFPGALIWDSTCSSPRLRGGGFSLSQEEKPSPLGEAWGCRGRGRQS